MTSSYRGFILQSTYRIQQGVPVVYVFGRLVTGETFEVRDTRQVPHFYIHRRDAIELVKDRSNPVLPIADGVVGRVSATDKVDFAGQALTKVEVGVPQEAPKVRDWLHRKGYATFEADVRFAMRYLIDRGIKCGVQINGVASTAEHVDLTFENPELEAVEVPAEPRVLSFDIETDPQADRLLAIAMYGCGLDEVVIVDPKARQMPPQAVGVGSEKEALQYFVEVIKRLDADVITGWNVTDFDLSVLAKVAKRVGYDLALGRGPGDLRIRPAEGYFGSGQATIPGRVVLDGLDLVRGAFIKLDDFSLDGVSQAILGEGKTFQTHGQAKVAEILSTYAHDLPRFAEYARTDARLVLEITDKLDLIALAFARSALTGMMPDRVAASIASFDFLYLCELEQMRIAAPSVAQPGQSRTPQGGGAVFEPTIGIHSNVWVCDFKSLYPSIIRTFNIDPLTYARAGETTVATYDGTRFDRQPGILPSLLDTLFPARATAKADGNEVASQAIKILMNSFYGVLGTPACRFYNPNIANAITSQGRALLNWSREWFTQRGYQVVYGDTDSVFVASGMSDADAAASLADELVERFNADLANYLKDRFQVDSKLELEFEKLYTSLFLAKTRGGGQGARKRYAGIKHGESEVDFVGMEVVRRDWTDLAKEVQRSLFTRLFQGDEVVDYLVQVVADLRAGRLDEQLIYRKGLRKSVDSYTTNIPPHVQAVKKALEQNADIQLGRIISYIVSQTGPELVGIEGVVPPEPDREHYLEKQIKPVAVPVLEALGLEFDQVIGDDTQISLF